MLTSADYAALDNRGYLLGPQRVSRIDLAYDIADEWRGREVMSEAEVASKGMFDEDMAQALQLNRSSGIRALVQQLSFQTPATYVQNVLNRHGLQLCQRFVLVTFTNGSITRQIRRSLRYATRVHDLVLKDSIDPSGNHVRNDLQSQFSKIDRLAKIDPAFAAEIPGMKLELVRDTVERSHLPAPSVISALIPTDLSAEDRLALLFPHASQAHLQAVLASPLFATIAGSLPAPTI